MTHAFIKHPIALATMATLGVISAVAAPTLAGAAKVAGTYAAGDFHNHSTCSDGAVSLQKKVKKSMDRTATTPWGLDWFVQAGHGGTGNRNCTLAEDATFATPAYPLVTDSAGTVLGPQTRWQQSAPPVQPKGSVSGTPPNQNMWRWQQIQEFQYPLMEYLAAYRNEPLFIGVESVVAGHEHTSMGVITGQIPAAVYTQTLPTTPGYTPLGNANALSMWQYCFDRGNSDISRGNTTTTSGIGNNWDCSVPGSLNARSPDWNAAAAKLNGANGDNGHTKTVEAIKWMKAFHPTGSYYVPAHLERAGPFNPAGNNGFNVEHLRNFNNAGPDVAFGFESQPGHGASDRRGEYNLRRNAIGTTRFDSIGGTTFGGTGVYAAQIGGVWDALLGEGRNWWFFASSDWHSRGAFSVDDRRSDNDFWPGEYQRNYSLVRHGGSRMNPQQIVDGLRSGNTFVDSGQLIDRLAFVACASYPGPATRTNAGVEAIAVEAAQANRDTDVAGCATMGEKLKVRRGADIVVAIVVRDPAGKSYSPYSFPNPSLLQVGINQPLDMPVLDHVDVVQGMGSGFKQPGASDYAGAWPDDWVNRGNPQQLRTLTSVPDAAKNLTAAVVKTFNSATWTTVAGQPEWKKMSFRIPAVVASQYVRLRGTNMPAAVPFETDVAGNPLSDLWTNTGAIQAKNSSAVEFAENSFLRIPCTTVATNAPDNGALFTTNGINGCPNHLPVINGTRMVGLDVAAWADLWFYSNPIFVEVAGSAAVAGVK
ncbi:MAG: hypothetical protein LH480_07190 [Rubrivivax sp.]|nr:hypothetical protein [Rubrivivax sp.]